MINQLLFTKPKKSQNPCPARRPSAQTVAKQFQKLRGPVSPSREPMEIDAAPSSTTHGRVIGSSQRDEAAAREFSRVKRDVARGKKPVEPSTQQDRSETEEDEPKVVKKPQKKSKQPSPEEYLNIFLARGFGGTRYPHRDTCKKLGIARDVEYLY